MPKVNIDIPNSQIEEVTRKELKSLKSKNLRLESKMWKLKQEILKNQDLVKGL